MTDLPKLENVLTVVMSHGELEAFAAENFEWETADVLRSEGAGEIPGVGIILSLLRDGVAVRDRLFQKKLFMFLASMNSMPKAERAEMIEKLGADPDYDRKVGEHLIEILDRLETHKKPRMLARVLRAYGAGEIDATMFHQLVHAIEHLPVFAIPAVRKFSLTNPPNLGAETAIQLYFGMAGLAVPQTSWDGTAYDPTPVAEAFLRLELDLQG
jgi:hypothetical protein